MSTTIRRSVMFSRRSFVEKLGLGMGAALLAPLAKNFISEAQGQATDRKIAVFTTVANGMNPYWTVTPPEFMESNADKGNVEPGGPSQPVSMGRNFTVPDSFLPFKPYQDRMLIMDGLVSHPQKGEDGGHGLGFLMYTQVPGTDVNHFIPGGISLDQALGKTLSAGAPRTALLIGRGAKAGDFKNKMFASSRGTSIPAFQNPSAFFTDLFGTGMAQASGMMPSSNPAKGRVLFDALKHDITRLQTSFAGSEKAKLDNYLKVIEDHEKSIQATANLNCSGGTAPGATTDDAQALVSLHAIASVALVCGMSNVMFMDVGCGDAHEDMPALDSIFADGTYFGADAPRLKGLLAQGESGFSGIGHDPYAVGGEVLKATHQFIGKLMASTIESLKGATLYDNSLSLFTSDNGGTHHSVHSRFPMVIVGNAGGKFKAADNRFMRHPDKSRSLLDLWTTIGTAFGASMDGFGLEPLEREFTKGVIADLLA